MWGTRTRARRPTCGSLLRCKRRLNRSHAIWPRSLTTYKAACIAKAKKNVIGKNGRKTVRLIRLSFAEIRGMRLGEVTPEFFAE